MNGSILSNKSPKPHNEVTSIIERLNSDLNDQLNSSACMPYKQYPLVLPFKKGKMSEQQTLDNSVSVAQIQNTTQENMFDDRTRGSG